GCRTFTNFGTFPSLKSLSMPAHLKDFITCEGYNATHYMSSIIQTDDDGNSPAFQLRRTGQHKIQSQRPRHRLKTGIVCLKPKEKDSPPELARRVCPIPLR